MSDQTTAQPAPQPSPTNGTPAPLPATPIAAPAEVTFTPEQQSVINQLVGQARKEGRESASKKIEAPPAPAPTPAQPMSADEQGRLTLKQLKEQFEISELRNAFNEHAADAGVALKGEKRGVIFELFKAQRPTDVPGWFEKMQGLGLFLDPKQTTAATQTAPTAPAAPPPPQATTPASDKGSPAPGGVLDWERELAENPIGMSVAARAAMDAKHGAEKARQMRLEAARAQSERIKVTR